MWSAFLVLASLWRVACQGNCILPGFIQQRPYNFLHLHICILASLWRVACQGNCILPGFVQQIPYNFLHLHICILASLWRGLPRKLYFTGFYTTKTIQFPPFSYLPGFCMTCQGRFGTTKTILFPPFALVFVQLRHTDVPICNHPSVLCTYIVHAIP